jgi:hypothetical protein
MHMNFARQLSDTAAPRIFKGIRNASVCRFFSTLAEVFHSARSAVTGLIFNARRAGK